MVMLATARVGRRDRDASLAQPGSLHWLFIGPRTLARDSFSGSVAAKLSRRALKMSSCRFLKTPSFSSSYIHHLRKPRAQFRLHACALSHSNE